MLDMRRFARRSDRISASATAVGVFDTTDAMQLRSSLTLFARVAPEDTRFAEAIARWFGGDYDAITDKRI